MDENILQKFDLLPPEQQEQVALFILFLFERYVEKQLAEVEKFEYAPPISENTKVYLDKRLEELENTPEKRYSIEEIEEKFRKKQERVSGNV